MQLMPPVTIVNDMWVGSSYVDHRVFGTTGFHGCIIAHCDVRPATAGVDNTITFACTNVSASALPQVEYSSCVLNAQQKLKLLPFRILNSTSSLAPVRSFLSVSGVPSPLYVRFVGWGWASLHDALVALWRGFFAI